jgi:hypothetical protein
VVVAAEVTRVMAHHSGHADPAKPPTGGALGGAFGAEQLERLVGRFTTAA